MFVLILKRVGLGLLTLFLVSALIFAGTQIYRAMSHQPFSVRMPPRKRSPRCAKASGLINRSLRAISRGSPGLLPAIWAPRLPTNNR